MNSTECCKKRVNMAISVIIPANGDKVETIDECLSSAYAQLGKKDTITLVSSEYKHHNIAKLKEKYPKVGIINVPQKLNPAKARNLGAHQAENDWLLFIDCDCTIEKGYFEKLTKILQANKNNFSGCVGALLPAKSNAGWSEYENYDHDFSIRKYIFEKGAKPLIKIGVGANMLIKKSAFLKESGFDEHLDSAEDRDLGIRLFLHGLPLQYRKELTAYHKYESSIFTIITRHLWHAKGNAQIYAKYPMIFDHPIKRRLATIKQLATQKTNISSIAYAALVTIPYLVYFSIWYYKYKLVE